MQVATQAPPLFLAGQHQALARAPQISGQTKSVHSGRRLARQLVQQAPVGRAIGFAGRARLHWLPGYQAGPWSPTGHTLALIGLKGVSLLREPGSPATAPQAIGPTGCTELAWKP